MADELILSETKIHKFAGDFPEVENWASINTELLYEGDERPFHVVLEIARVGETSENGMFYDESVITEIETQLPGLGGLRGHLPKENRGTAFPIEDIDWIGHKRVGPSLWAKAYVPPGRNRDELRRRRARGGGLATSIYGPYAKVVKLANGAWKPEGLTLETVDLAPVTRSALKLGGGFKITAEMETKNEENNMSDDQSLVVSELTTQRDTAQNQLAEMTGKYDGVVAELTGLFGDDWKVGATAMVAEMKVLRSNQLKADITGVIAELVELESLRPVIAEMVGIVDSKDAAKARVESLLASEPVKHLATALAMEISGGRAIVGGKGKSADSAAIDELVENAAKNARNLGIPVGGQ